MKIQETMMLYMTKTETVSGLHCQAAKRYSMRGASFTPMKKYWPSGIFCTSVLAMPQSSIYWSRKDQTMYQIN